MKTPRLSAIAFCASLILFCSCSEKKSEVVSIDLKNCVAPAEMFEPDFEIIPLETTEESLIGEIEKVKLHDSCFFVEDRTQKAILIFDWKGKYLNKISRLGRGPGEYVNILDFDVYDGFVCVFSGSGYVLRYDTSGKFIDQMEVDDAYCSMLVAGRDSILLFANNISNSKLNYRLLDWKTGGVLDEWDKFEARGMGVGKWSPMCRTDKGILLSKLFDYSMCLYNQSGYNKIVEVDFPGLDKIPETPETFYEKSRVIVSNGLNVVTHFEQTMSYKGKLYLYYNCTEDCYVDGIKAAKFMQYLSEIDVNTKEQRTVAIDGYTKRENFPFLGCRVTALQDGKLVTSIPCNTILNYKPDCVTRYPQLANIKEDDNLVFIVHHVK